MGALATLYREQEENATQDHHFHWQHIFVVACSFSKNAGQILMHAGSWHQKITGGFALLIHLFCSEHIFVKRSCLFQLSELDPCGPRLSWKTSCISYSGLAPRLWGHSPKYYQFPSPLGNCHLKDLCPGGEEWWLRALSLELNISRILQIVQPFIYQPAQGQELLSL